MNLFWADLSHLKPLCIGSWGLSRGVSGQFGVAKQKQDEIDGRLVVGDLQKKDVYLMHYCLLSYN